MFESTPDKKFTKKSFDKNDRFDKGDKNSMPHLSLAEEIIQLDTDLIRMIAKRCRLTAKMRGGKNHAVTPKAIKSEKEVRSSWESQATKFSRDPHFVRQLFTLLQDLEVQTLEEAKSISAFNLAPTRSPLALKWTGPVSGRSASLWATLAAITGSETILEPVMRSDAISDCVKALNQAGGKLVWTKTEILENQGREAITLTEKTIYAGEDFFNLCLLSFIALKDPGRVRFTGGSNLKSADLSTLRHFLPTLGARLAHVVPGSNGLPATLECSGVLPHSITIPETLPAEAFEALLLAVLIWNVDITLHFGEMPAEIASAALALVVPLCRASGAETDVQGASIRFTPGEIQVPARPVLVMDPVISSNLLALPFFTGGNIELDGRWPDFLPDSAVAVSMLRQFGLNITLEPTFIRSANEKPSPFAGIAMDGSRLPENLIPLFSAMVAVAAKKTQEGVPYPNFPEETDQEVIQDFFAQLGLAEENGLLKAIPGLEKENSASQNYGWTSPSPFWTLAFSLCAFAKPNLKLSNPGSATEIIPGYWGIYNALPTPDKAPKVTEIKENTNAGKGKRRIIAE